MRAITNCNTCRKKIADEVYKQYMKEGYDFMEAGIESSVDLAIAAVLAVMVKRNRSPKYIKQLFDDICDVLKISYVFGKAIRMEDIMKQYEKEYGIDWDKVEVHMEDFKRMLTRARLEAKEDNSKESEMK